MTRTSSPLNLTVNVIAPAETRLPLKGVVAVVVGNWLEFYMMPHDEVVHERATPALAHA